MKMDASPLESSPYCNKRCKLRVRDVNARQEVNRNKGLQEWLHRDSVISLLDMAESIKTHTLTWLSMRKGGITTPSLFAWSHVKE